MKKENLDLAKAEVLSIVDCTVVDFRHDYLLICVTHTLDNALLSRLAFTKSVHKVLFACTAQAFEQTIGNFDFETHYDENYCVRTHTISGRSDYSEKAIASMIWDRLQKPIVSLDHPKTPFSFFIIDDHITCCLTSYVAENEYDKRRSHLRPRPSPVSLHPRLARAMVNLTGAKHGTIVDPFCGSGGIIIEAGLMGFSTIGYDINRKMLWKSMVNVNKYNVKSVLEVKDFFSINTKHDYIVADLPYGLNANIMEGVRITNRNKNHTKPYVHEFYKKLFMHLHKILGKRAVIMVPHYVDYKQLVDDTGLRLLFEFSWYIHRNLTRKILVLEQQGKTIKTEQA